MIGQRVRRVEDRALVTGAARYAGDIDVDALEVSFVRATVAHAHISATSFSGTASSRNFFPKRPHLAHLERQYWPS